MDEYKNSVHFSKDIDYLNNILPNLIKLTNDEIALEQNQIDYHFSSIDDLSLAISKNDKDPFLFLLEQ